VKCEKRLNYEKIGLYVDVPVYNKKTSRTLHAEDSAEINN
jgi:hypothetical protein